MLQRTAVFFGTLDGLTRPECAGSVRFIKMLKLVGKIAFCFVLLLVKAFAQEREEQILFLHLERDANGVKLLRSTSVPGKVKEGVRRGALEYDVVNEAGEVVYRGGCPNPGRERIEYADVIEPGRLRSMRVRTCMP